MPHTDFPPATPLKDLLPGWTEPYIQLARLDRPIGTWLLLFPGLWTLTLAGQGLSALYYIFLFIIGAVLIRGAGCTYNDIIDRKLDKKVTRTATRPLPSGQLTLKQAFQFLMLQLTLAFLILLALPTPAILIGIIAVPMILTYPWMKRFTYWPQAFLGITFNLGALMGWATIKHALEWPGFLVYLACIFWTLAYDTIYAHQDKQDDRLIGIKSTALKLGTYTKPFLIFCYIEMVVLLGVAAKIVHTGWLFYLGLIVVSGFVYQLINKLDINDPKNCLTIFKANKHVGWIVLLAILLAKAF